MKTSDIWMKKRTRASIMDIYQYILLKKNNANARKKNSSKFLYAFELKLKN